MIDPSEREIEAIKASSAPAGEAIEEIVRNGGSTDMATWSSDQWFCFLEVVVTAYSAELSRLRADEVPF